MMKKIQSLNAIRFIMIMFIVFSHFDSLASTEETKCLFHAFLKHPTPAVDYFFVLSGFGMMYSYINKGIVLKCSLKDLCGFAVAHVRRIYKVYLITLLAGIPLNIIHLRLANGSIDLQYIVLAIAKLILCIPLFQSLSGSTLFSHAFNGVSWFLSCLFCIYIVSPFLLNRLRKSNYNLFVMVGVNIMFLGVTRSLLKLFQNDFFDDLVYGSPYVRIFYVITGMLLAKLFVNLQKKKTFFQTHSLGANVFEVFLLFFAVTFFLIKNILWIEIPSYVPYISLIFVCIIILSFSVESGLVSKFLQKKWMNVLGDMSMYIFLLHYPIRLYIYYMLRLLGFHKSLLLTFLYVFLTLTTTFLLSFYLLKYGKNMKKV